MNLTAIERGSDMPDWIEYKIVRVSDLELFEFEVNRHIRLGYLPLGGVGITDIYYIQAMTLDRANAITR